MMPHARLHPSAPMSMVRTSARSASATLREPVKVRTMINPKSTSAMRSAGWSTDLVLSALVAMRVRGKPAVIRAWAESPRRAQCASIGKPFATANGDRSDRVISLWADHDCHKRPDVHAAVAWRVGARTDAPDEAAVGADRRADSARDDA